jgi:hypothetical protein
MITFVSLEQRMYRNDVGIIYRLSIQSELTLENNLWEPSSAKQRLGKHVSTEMQFLDKQSVAR